MGRGREKVSDRECKKKSQDELEEREELHSETGETERDR